ncbi:MAG: hypothetical protein MUF00_08205 [Gemmatimonadaceae bacterium]|jgi:uncharacterized membrane protein|nr:hypothetical protein [Gemmatimonadaceae bacterium]
MMTRADREAIAKRYRVIAVGLLVSMVLLALTASWGFGTGNTILGGVLAVAAALEGAAAVFFWIKSNG